MMRNWAIAAAVLLVWATSLASGSSLVLSEYSSDSTPASVLDAMLDFDVNETVLIIVVTNQTDGNDAYDINEFYFNAPNNVTGLVIVDPNEGWAVSTNDGADGFGKFSFALKDGVGSDPDKIEPNSAMTFTFNISGTGPFFDTDFTTHKSTNPPGSIEALAAAKFVSGPGDDSAYGATTFPEPACGMLLAMGGAAGLLLRRRRRPSFDVK